MFNLSVNSNLVVSLKRNVYICIGLSFKHFCLQPFFPKDWVFLQFTKSVDLDLQIIGKCISTHFLTSEHTLSIADKNHFPYEYFGLVILQSTLKIPSPKLVHKSRYLTRKAALLVNHTIFFVTSMIVSVGHV